MEVDGQGVALEPPQPQVPLFVPVLPSSAPPAQPPAVPSEPAPTEPPPSQHAAAQPMGIVQFCTLLLWTNHRAKGGHVDKVHLQARCMKSMQAVRAKSVSPTSRGLRLPLSPSHSVKLLTSHKMMRKRERRRLSKRPHARSGWKSFPELSGPVAWCCQLHKKVSQIEIGRLEDGIDDGEPDFDFDFCADDGSDDDDDDGDDDALWLEDEEGSDEVEEFIFALNPDSVAVCHDELWYQLKHGLQV